MKRKISALFLAMLTALTLSSCGSKNVLLFLNWGEYIDETLIEDFENLYNCEVQMDLGESNEIFYSKVSAGTTVYDVVCPSDYMVEKLYKNDMLAEIDFNKIPAFDKNNLRPGVKKIYDDMNVELTNIMDSYKNGSVDNYFIPYLWGTWGICYTTKKAGVEEAVVNSKNSWASLFDRSVLPAGTKVAQYDSHQHAYYAACRYLQNEGYEIDPQTELNDSNLEMIEKLIANMKYNAWGTDTIKKDIVSGNIDLGFMWTGDFLYYYCENAANITMDAYLAGDISIDEVGEFLDSITGEEAKYEKNGNSYDIGFNLYIPDDTIAFCDNLVITKDSVHKDLAHQFINFLISRNFDDTKVKNDVRDVEFTNDDPAYAYTYYVSYDAPYNDVYNDLVALKDTEFDQEMEDDFKASTGDAYDSDLYWVMYDYAIGIAFDKYYPYDSTKGTKLSCFDRKYIRKINNTFNNARA